MKKLFIFFMALVFSSITWGQSVIIGTGTLTTNGSSADPLERYYNYEHFQIVYTAAELTAGGMAAGSSITALGFSVSESAVSLANFTISMGLTSQALANPYIPVSGLTTVKNSFTYVPVVQTAGNFHMITFDTPFIWNGTSNIVVNTCTGSNPYTSPYGGVRYTSSTSGSVRYNRLDGASPNCSNATTSNTGNRPNIKFDYTASNACSGTPTPGYTLSSVASACSGTNFGLSLQNATTGSGVSYQWQSSPDNSTWTNITGATYASLTVNQTVATWYQCNVTCSGNTGTSTPVQVNMNPFYNCYCPSAATSTGDEEITNVSFGTTLNNTTACASLIGNQGTATGTADLYSDFRATVTPVTVSSGTTVPISVGVTLCAGSPYGHMTKVYIDFNHNGLLTDAGEEFIIYPYTSSNTHTINSTIAIPLTALLGNTLMRVVLKESSSFGPCDVNSYGETEDYLINIAPPPSCIPPSGLTALNITAFSADVQWTENGTATLWDIEYGNFGFTQGTGILLEDITYPMTLDLSPNTQYSYFVRSKCGGSNSPWSGPYTFTTLISCYSPTAVTVNSVTSNSASVGWMAQAPEFAIEYGVAPYNFTGNPNVNGILNTGYNFSNLLPETTYLFRVKAICAPGDESTWTTTSTIYTGHCKPAPSSVDGNGITNVTFGTINNSTLTEPNNYGNYSAMVTDVIQGATVPVAITYQTGFTYDTKIWIDWNDDLDFTDSGEEVYVGTSTNSNPTTLNASFVVPGTATIGTHRLRIGGQDSGPAVPCYTGSWGSFEDYTVNVIAPQLPEILSLSTNSGCVGSSLIIYGSNLTGTTTVTIGGSPATITANTSTSVTVTVGSGTTGLVYLTNLAGAATSADIFTVNQLPNIFTVSGGGTYCEAGTGVSISLSGSETGIDYVLSTSPTTTLSGNGNSLTFGPTAFNAGTYTITAQNSLTGCSQLMTGSAIVIINPLPTALTLTPSSNSLVYGNIQPLVVSGGVVSNVSILTENFNGLTNSWTTFNNSTGGTYLAAEWTLRPDAYIYSSTTFHSNDNSQFYLSNSDEQGSGGTTATILQSPSFSTLGFTSVNVNFYHYYYHYSGSTAKLEASTDGSIWTTLQTYSATTGSATAFSNASIALTPSFLNQPTVYVRFKYDASYGFYWAIDNVAVKGDGPANMLWSPVTGLYTDPIASTPYDGISQLSTLYAKLNTGSYNYQVTATSPTGCIINSNVANINITPAELTVSGATVTTKVYDGNTDASITGATITGVISPDVVTLSNTATGTFNDKNVGTGKLVTSFMTIGGADATNYYITQPTLSGNITPAELTVSDAVVTTKVYDGNTDAAITGAIITGVISPDVVTLLNSTTGTFNNKNVGTGKLVTTSMTIGDTDAANYLLTQPVLNGNITPAPLTITADDKSKDYDGLVYSPFTVSYSGFVFGETDANLGGSLTFGGSAVTATDNGMYSIIPGGLTSANYNITYVNGILNILSPSSVYIFNNNNNGYGSLRNAIANITEGGTLLFDEAVDGQIITLTTGPIIVNKSLKFDNSNHEMGVSINGDDVQILFGKSLTLLTGSKLSVLKSLINYAGRPGLIINSGASLIHNTRDLPATVIRELNDGWHLFGSPFKKNAGASLANLIPSGGGVQMRPYTNGSGWGAITSSPYILFNPMVGYAVKPSVPVNASLTGNLFYTPVTFEFNFNLSYTGGSASQSWNLVSNPYTSPIDWRLLSRTNVNSTLYLWDNTMYSYFPIVSASYFRTYNGLTNIGVPANTLPYIAPQQGFFVKAVWTNPKLGFAPKARVHNTTNYYKASNTTEVLLRLKTESEYGADEMVICKNQNAKQDLEDFDSEKMLSDLPLEMYSQAASGEKLTINTIENTDIVIPLVIKGNVGSKAKITAFELGSSEDVYLEDRLTNKLISLAENTTYSFEFPTELVEGRFFIRFGKMNTPLSSSEIKVFANNNELNVIAQIGEELLQVEVYTITGACVFKSDINNGNKFNTKLDLSTGVYMVRVKTSVSTQNVKINWK